MLSGTLMIHCNPEKQESNCVADPHDPGLPWAECLSICLLPTPIDEAGMHLRLFASPLQRKHTIYSHLVALWDLQSAWSLNWVFLTRQQPDQHLGERRSQQSCCPEKLCDYNTLNYIYKVLYGMGQCCILNPVFIVVPNNYACWMALTHKHGINVLVGTGDRTAWTSLLLGCSFVNRGKLKCFLGLYVVSFSTVDSPQSSQSLHFLLYFFLFLTW